MEVDEIFILIVLCGFFHFLCFMSFLTSTNSLLSDFSLLPDRLTWESAQQLNGPVMTRVSVPAGHQNG